VADPARDRTPTYGRDLPGFLAALVAARDLVDADGSSPAE
jgi:hypothetical protein